MDLVKIADAINVLGRFCGMRDVAELNGENLYRRLGFSRADVMVLFGGSILAGGDILAEAMRNRAAEKYVIVGGAGHTTETLRQRVHTEFPSIFTEGRCEAEIFDDYLFAVYGMRADYLEKASTNCGNNITNLLDLLDQNRISRDSMILCQDASMQRRMDAGLRKFAPETTIVNYATYAVTARVSGETLTFEQTPHGMWDMERYVNLLMGEFPRLTDTPIGYGPAGKNFIAHVDVPDEAQEAFSILREAFGDQIREANPLYASR